MQIVGASLLMFVVWFGFRDRTGVQISAFDGHAMVMVLGGSLAAVMISSNRQAALRTLIYLRELLPAFGLLRRDTRQMEEERLQLYALWNDGKRAQALELADRSRHAPIKQMLELSLNRAHEASTAKVFLEMRHDEVGRWQPAIHNWEMLSKLGPSFGMVGTITGMIQMFRNMSAENLNIGASMSLALLATLYGVAFGAGVAGPIGHFLNGLLDERLGLLERCAQSVNEIVARGSASSRRGG